MELFRLKKDLPGLEAGNIVYCEENIRKSDGIKMSQLSIGLNEIVGANIYNEEWFEKLEQKSNLPCFIHKNKMYRPGDKFYKDIELIYYLKEILDVNQIKYNKDLFYKI